MFGLEHRFHVQVLNKILSIKKLSSNFALGKIMKKIAFITGASSGIGLETALELLDKGYTVYGGARRIELMKPIEEKGGKILKIDVTSEESIKSAIDTIIQNEGRIDVLVNNAGFGLCGCLEEVPIEVGKNQFDVNVFGLVRTTQLVLPHMRKNKFGKIVNISSMGGKFSSPFGGWYHSTKYAVEALSDALRMEVKSFGIDVILIEPGLIRTNWGIIAAENIRKTSMNGAYEKNAECAAQYYERNYEKNKERLPDATLISKTIYKALKAKHPKTRYLVGKLAKFSVTLKYFLPDKLYQKVTARFMGIKL